VLRLSRIGILLEVKNVLFLTHLNDAAEGCPRRASRSHPMGVVKVVLARPTKSGRHEPGFRGWGVATYEKSVRRPWASRERA
jgi:hypothetical protein